MELKLPKFKLNKVVLVHGVARWIKRRIYQVKGSCTYLVWQLSLVKEDKKFSLSVYHLKAILCNFFGYLRVLYYLSGITI